MQETVRQFVEHTKKDEINDSYLPELSAYKDMYIDRSNSMSRAIRILIQSKYDLVLQHKRDMETMEQVMALAKRITGTDL